MKIKNFLAEKKGTVAHGIKRGRGTGIKRYTLNERGGTGVDRPCLGDDSWVQRGRYISCISPRSAFDPETIVKGGEAPRRPPPSPPPPCLGRSAFNYLGFLRQSMPYPPPPPPCFDVSYGFFSIFVSLFRNLFFFFFFRSRAPFSNAVGMYAC